MSDKKSDPLSLSPGTPSKSMEKADEAINTAFHECVVAVGMGVCDTYRNLRDHPILSAMYVFCIFSLCYDAADRRLVAYLLLEPEAGLTLERLSPIISAPWETHFLGWSIFASVVTLLALGINALIRIANCRKLFCSIGLTTGLKEVPTLIYCNKPDKYREVLEFRAKGIGINRFKSKAQDIEAFFGKAVESIEHGIDQSRVKVILTKHKLPDRVNYTDISKSHPLPENSFYIGHSIEGIKTQDISELPHLLIAGATGGGKSVFFKQAMMGLLESTRSLQLYAVDLKGGLEMSDFSAAPNVKVVKDLGQAVALLSALNREMKHRFKYLEEKGYREIKPKRDKKDRIVLAVDEASVLFTALPRSSADYKNSQTARTLLDSLAKLSRAAAIHIVLATQKLDKQVLPTQVSENISGRMAFKANSVPGSTLVVYTRDAADLPEIKGRGIWLFGSNKFMVQAPYISEKEIKDSAKRIKAEFDAGPRKLQSSMVGFDIRQSLQSQTECMNEELGAN